jgi:purine-nucleoside phosphorylase
MSEFDKLVQARAFLMGLGPLHTRNFPPTVGITLGSGLGYMVDLLENSSSVIYKSIPHCPVSSAPDHAGRLWFGQLKGVNVVMCQGRVHLYEGYDIQQVVFLTRLMAILGAKQMILTHATGATTNNLKPRDIVGIRDHIALDCPDPTAGAREPEFEKAFGLEFTPMAKAYSPRLLALAAARALELGVAFRLGVSYFKKGRTFETAAEIEKMRRDGADVATMSTVPEVIAAHQLGVEVLDLALVTNMGTGLGDVSHAGVVSVARSMKEKFGGFIMDIVPKMTTLLRK